MSNQDDSALPVMLRFRAFPCEQVYANSLEFADAGLYVFVRVEPPHFIYLGRSLSLIKRLKAQRRIRQVFLYLMVFDFPGLQMSLSTSMDLERRLLRAAWDRWGWARWTNQTDLWVKFFDRCVWPGSPSMMDVVERVLTGVEEFMAAQATFDPRRPAYLRMTRIFGRPSDEVHAFGRPGPSGFTVLAGSRLSLRFRSFAQLRTAESPEARLALRLWKDGLLDRKSGTRTREEGIYFLRDQAFATSQVASSILLGRQAETEQWRKPTEPELLRFDVPPGSHPRWR